MASNIASAAMWAAVFTPTADEIAKEIVAEEARLREIEEKAYWEAYWKAWDRAYKEGVIKDLRDHKEGYWLMTWNKQPIYPHLSQDDIADLVEKGEIILISLRTLKITTFMWADETREEAKHPAYIELQKANKEDMQKGEYRIIP
ncbi:hypothetical protein [uncultured Helicobacter sp.]|uniref:hypothetical protein n=1 Tax=uncultured Helicobacter sp. TaxID=175537 RepID=UPI003752EDAE